MENNRDLKAIYKAYAEHVKLEHPAMYKRYYDDIEKYFYQH